MGTRTETTAATESETPAHTPTPYTVNRLSFGEGELLAGGKAIALFYCSDGHDEPTPFPGIANARFVALACNSQAEIIGALEAARDLVQQQLTEGAPIPSVGEYRAVVKRANAALALARGEIQ